MEYYGILPQQKFYPLSREVYNNLRYGFALNIFVMYCILIALSYSAGLFAKIKENREKCLLDSGRRFEAKSMQLEDIAKRLKKQVAENKYIKSTTMGYIAKKEFELEMARKDLEDQIEKLRKTQKSMYFMIEDLNQMSAQLKDAKDNLEHKVRKRTDDLLTISRKLHRSEKLAFLGKLAGSVTHELRNPLAVLKNTAYYLDRKLKDNGDEKVLKYLDTLKREIVVIDSIIDDIMGFAKSKVPDYMYKDLGELLGNAIEAIAIPELIKVKKDFKPVPKVMIDAEQTMHALINIANNAIMAMNGNGTLTFRVMREDDQAVIEIEDTGPGISPEEKSLIFEPLYSSKPKGTGLGLPIAKMTIESQDGKIEFDTKLGEGTTFRISFPINRGTREV